MARDVIEDEELPPARRSSWSAALSQLPGFPAEERPKIPSASASAARQISSGIAEEEGEEKGEEEGEEEGEEGAI
jgi:hypothetical protein